MPVRARLSTEERRQRRCICCEQLADVPLVAAGAVAAGVVAAGRAVRRASPACSRERGRAIDRRIGRRAGASLGRHGRARAHVAAQTEEERRADAGPSPLVAGAAVCAGRVARAGRAARPSEGRRAGAGTCRRVTPAPRVAVVRAVQVLAAVTVGADVALARPFPDAHAAVVVVERRVLAAAATRAVSRALRVLARVAEEAILAFAVAAVDLRLRRHAPAPVARLRPRKDRAVAVVPGPIRDRVAL